MDSVALQVYLYLCFLRWFQDRHQLFLLTIFCVSAKVSWCFWRVELLRQEKLFNEAFWWFDCLF
jgi:hypothetical protein